MQLTMYNVKFGDCFLLSENNDGLLVDFGSKNSSKSFKDLATVVEIVKADVKNIKGQKDAMLTHYHQDHYRFFVDWKKELKRCTDSENTGIFDTFYLPYIYYDKDNQLCTLAKEAIYTYILTKGKSKRAKFFLADQMELILNLVKRNGTVRLLSQNDTFYISDASCEVLWPQKENFITTNLSEFQEYIWNKLNNNKIPINLQDIKQKLKKLENNVCEFYQLFSVNDNDTLSPWNDEIRKRIEKLIRMQDNILEELKKLTTKVKWDNDKKEKLRDIYKKDNNATSVVFRIPCEQSTEKNCHRLLMTGDITKDIIKNNLRQYFINQYYVCIKCPHHGTDSHYHDYMRQCEYLLISTDEISSNYGEISKKYESVRPIGDIADTKRLVRKICTNGDNYCELINDNRQCFEEEWRYCQKNKRCFQTYSKTCLLFPNILSQCHVTEKATVYFSNRLCSLENNKKGSKNG